MSFFNTFSHTHASSTLFNESLFSTLFCGTLTSILKSLAVILPPTDGVRVGFLFLFLFSLF